VTSAPPLTATPLAEGRGNPSRAVPAPAGRPRVRAKFHGGANTEAGEGDEGRVGRGMPEKREEIGGRGDSPRAAG
jgi:hypothetical protein